MTGSSTLPVMMDLEKLRENSGIRIDREGQFWFREGPVENEKVHDLFSSGLSVRPDGRTILTVGKQWCYVEVEDTPWIIQGVRCDEQGVVLLRLNTGKTHELQAASLFLSTDGFLYCRIGERKTLARFSRPAFHRFAHEFFVESRGGTFDVVINGRVHPLNSGNRAELSLLPKTR